MRSKKVRIIKDSQIKESNKYTLYLFFFVIDSC